MHLSVQEIYFIMIVLVIFSFLVNVTAYFFSKELLKKTIKISKVLLVAILLANAVLIIYKYNNRNKTDIAFLMLN